MKTILVTLALVIMLAAATDAGLAQNVNWRALRGGQENLLHLGAGYDYGVTTGLSYGRFVDLGRPVLVGLDLSLPMGGDLLDDFKLRVGAQAEVVRSAGFSATIRVQSNFRRYENALVRIVSFGSDFGLVSGYYAESWYAAGEFGFDKSITSHLKHSAAMKRSFPAIRDGWYIPSGGHFYYGVQGGVGLGESLDLSLRAGATNAQGSDENAVLPWYAQLGLGIRF
jgi:hypothetical protein